MNTAQKIGMGVIGVAMLTTISLPDRVFYKVIDAIRKLAQGTLGTAMGTLKGDALTR